MTTNLQLGSRVRCIGCQKPCYVRGVVIELGPRRVKILSDSGYEGWLGEDELELDENGLDRMLELVK